MDRDESAHVDGERRVAPLIPAVHFGPGRLGLGFIVDVLLTTGRYDVSVLGRPDSPPEERTYRIRFTDPSIGVRERRVSWAGNPRAVEDLPARVVAQLEADAPLLVTAALGDGQTADARERIAAILAVRPRTADTVLLACENEAKNIFDDLARAFPHVKVRRCVVDRICAWDPEPPDGPGKRILAHDVSEWVIPHADPTAETAAPDGAPALARAVWPPLAGLLGADHVVLLASGERAHKHRKLWLVNGVHMVLATMARASGHDLLPPTTETREEFVRGGTPLMRAMLRAVDREHGLPANDSFAAERVRAFCEAPDSAQRVLAGRYLRADLRPFVERLATRLGTAAATAHRNGLDVEPFLWAFTRVADAMREDLSYLDVGEVDRDTGRLRLDPTGPVVSEEIDDEVVATFAASLEPWAPEPIRTRLVRTVERALATWRDH